MERKKENSSSKYFGVCLNNHKSIKKGVEYNYTYWVSEIKNILFRKVIGYYKTEIEAAKAYDEYILENCLNTTYPLNFKKGE